MFGITALICGVLFHTLSDTQKLRATLEQADWTWFGVAIVLTGANLMMSTVRWRIILSSMNVKLSTYRALHAILSTWPFALITPSRASDLLRAVVIRDKLPIAEGSSSVVAEKLVDVQSLCILATLGSLWAQQWFLAFLTFCMLVAEWIVALLLLRYHKTIASWPVLNKAEHKIVRLFKAFEALQRRPGHFVLLSCASLFSWLLALGILSMLLLSFGVSFHPMHVVALWPVSIFVGMLPLTVAGVGTRDAAFLALFQLTSASPIDETPVLAATLSYAIITAWLPAVLGLPWMLLSMKTMFQEDQSKTPDESV